MCERVLVQAGACSPIPIGARLCLKETKHLQFAKESHSNRPKGKWAEWQLG